MTSPWRACASLSTGPWRVLRTMWLTSGWPFTRMVSMRSVEVGPDRLGGAARHPVLRRVGRVDLFDVEVLHIRPGVGKAPGHSARCVPAPQTAGPAGWRRSRPWRPWRSVSAWPRRLQPREVPDGRRAQAQVRVVGQQGHARLAAGARHHPVVGCPCPRCCPVAGEFVGPASMPALICRDKGPARCAASGEVCATESIPSEMLAMFPIHWRGTRPDRGTAQPGRPWPRAAHPGTAGTAATARSVSSVCSGRQARKLIAPVAAQVQRHHERPAHAVLRIPVAPASPPGLDTQHIELGRQRLRAVLAKNALMPSL